MLVEKCLALAHQDRANFETEFERDLASMQESLWSVQAEVLARDIPRRDGFGGFGDRPVLLSNGSGNQRADTPQSGDDADDRAILIDIERSSDVYEEVPDPNMLRLLKAHPLLFRGKLPRISSQLSTGWWETVDKLCRDIEIALGSEECSTFTCHQIKEKFGTLRFYWSHGDSDDLHVDVLGPEGEVSELVTSGRSNAQQARVRELVDAAMSASEFICELCGGAGRLMCRDGWYLTRCNQHAGPGGSADISKNDHLL